MAEATCELSAASAVMCPCVAFEDWQLGHLHRTVVEKYGLLSAKCVVCQVFEECQVFTTRLHLHLFSDGSSLQCQEALLLHPTLALLHLPPVLLLQGRQGAHHLAHLRARAELL